MKALRLLAPFRRKSAATEAASAADHIRAAPSLAPESPATGETAAEIVAQPSSIAAASTKSVASESDFTSTAPPRAASSHAPPNVVSASGSGLAPGGALSSNNALSPGGALPPLSGVRSLPRPALRWVGQAGRIALRELDFAADADIVCSWQSETYTLNFADFRFNDSFAAAFRHDLRRAALDPNHGLFVLDDGAPIGFLWLVICENTWTGERYGYINNLYLTPAQRSQGLGNELMIQSETWFKSRRIKRVRLTVTIANEAACRLYQNRGYQETRWEMEKNL